jgi:superfamily I DNA/RNA helicase
VVVRTREQRDRYQRALEERGLRGTTLERAAAPAALGALSFATMHRVKGLEFDRVALVGLEEGVLPLDAALRATDDPPLRRAAEQRERALLYVAATRSRGEVLLSAAGRGSGWIWG